MPTPIESMASVVIGPMFMIDPARPVLAESPNAVERCNPLTCYRGDLQVRSNTRWQLQLRLGAGSGISAPISWFPLSGAVLLLSEQWQTVANGTQPTAGTPLLVRLSSGGPSAQRPSAAQLSAALEYRMIPLP